jgi:transcriptional regulator with XRE-family HTH domain
MDLNWRARADRLLKQKGISMRAASLQIVARRPGLKGKKNDSLVRDWINNGHEPSIDGFCALAELLGVSPLMLLQGDERFQVRVPLAGMSTGAERWTPFAEPGRGRTPEMADFTFGEGEAFAIEIRGDAMSPTYRDGDQLFCQKLAGKHFDNLVGLDCAVETAAGETLIKILDKGTEPGRYTLRSFNPLSKPIENVELASAARITWVRRSGR